MKHGLVTLACVWAVVACSTSSSSDDRSDAACAGKPVPERACIGGKREPRCNVLPSGESRWQIDCLRGVPETAPIGSAISSCQPGACGAEPSWDDAECMYGSGASDCSSIDRGPCTWRRACLPKPCEPGAPACNTLVESEIGPPCDLDAGAGAACAEGSCVTITANVGDETIGPVCVKDPCKALVCAEGRSCAVLTSQPGQVVCGR